MKKKEPAITYSELSELIVDAIRNENFFNKETLIPKIRAIISGFSFKIASTNYKCTDTPSERGKTLRDLEKTYFEKTFWQRKAKEISPGNIKKYYDELDIELEKYGFK